MWRVNIVETLTGDSIVQLPVVSGRWRKQINGFGQGQHVFHLRDALTARPRVYWRDAFAEVRRTLVVSWDGAAVYAGIIVGTDWDADAGLLTVRHVEARWLLAGRLAHSIPGWGPTGKTTYSGKSLRGIARALFAQAFATAVTQRNLPIDLGADETGTQSREWEWYNFASLDEMLQQVQESEGGPDVALEPEWRSDGLWWRLLLGNPRISGPTHEFVRGVAGSPVKSWRHNTDASKMLTGVWALGEGSEADRLVASAQVATQPDMPIVERSFAHGTLEEQSVVDAYAASLMESYALPTEQWSFRLDVTQGVDVAALTLGSTARAWSPEDEWDVQGWVEGYVLAVSGDMSYELDVEVQS